MTTVPQPVVRAFRRESTSSEEPYSTCVIQSVSGSPYGVDVTLSQAKALSLALSHAILEHELGEADRRPDAGWRTAPRSTD
jgi:hypothetical protein